MATTRDRLAEFQTVSSLAEMILPVDHSRLEPRRPLPTAVLQLSIFQKQKLTYTQLTKLLQWSASLERCERYSSSHHQDSNPKLLFFQIENLNARLDSLVLSTEAVRKKHRYINSVPTTEERTFSFCQHSKASHEIL